MHILIFLLLFCVSFCLIHRSTNPYFEIASFLSENNYIYNVHLSECIFPPFFNEIDPGEIVLTSEDSLDIITIRSKTFVTYIRKDRFIPTINCEHIVVDPNHNKFGTAFVKSTSLIGSRIQLFPFVPQCETLLIMTGVLLPILFPSPLQSEVYLVLKLSLPYLSDSTQFIVTYCPKISPGNIYLVHEKLTMVIRFPDIFRSIYSSPKLVIIQREHEELYYTADYSILHYSSSSDLFYLMKTKRCPAGLSLNTFNWDFLSVHHLGILPYKHCKSTATQRNSDLFQSNILRRKTRPPRPTKFIPASSFPQSCPANDIQKNVQGYDFHPGLRRQIFLSFFLGLSSRSVSEDSLVQCIHHLVSVSRYDFLANIVSESNLSYTDVLTVLQIVNDQTLKFQMSKKNDFNGGIAARVLKAIYISHSQIKEDTFSTQKLDSDTLNVLKASFNFESTASTSKAKSDEASLFLKSKIRSLTMVSIGIENIASIEDDISSPPSITLISVWNFILFESMDDDSDRIEKNNGLHIIVSKHLVDISSTIVNDKINNKLILSSTVDIIHSNFNELGCPASFPDDTFSTQRIMMSSLFESLYYPTSKTAQWFHIPLLPSPNMPIIDSSKIDARNLQFGKYVISFPYMGDAYLETNWQPNCQSAVRYWGNVFDISKSEFIVSSLNILKIISENYNDFFPINENIGLQSKLQFILNLSKFIRVVVPPLSYKCTEDKKSNPWIILYDYIDKLKKKIFEDAKDLRKTMKQAEDFFISPSLSFSSIFDISKQGFIPEDKIVATTRKIIDPEFYFKDLFETKIWSAGNKFEILATLLSLCIENGYTEQSNDCRNLQTDIIKIDLPNADLLSERIVDELRKASLEYIPESKHHFTVSPFVASMIYYPSKWSEKFLSEIATALESTNSAKINAISSKEMLLDLIINNKKDDKEDTESEIDSEESENGKAAGRPQEIITAKALSKLLKYVGYVDSVIGDIHMSPLTFESIASLFKVFCDNIKDKNFNESCQKNLNGVHVQSKALDTIKKTHIITPAESNEVTNPHRTFSAEMTRWLYSLNNGMLLNLESSLFILREIDNFSSLTGSSHSTEYHPNSESFFPNLASNLDDVDIWLNSPQKLISAYKRRLKWKRKIIALSIRIADYNIKFKIYAELKSIDIHPDQIIPPMLLFSDATLERIAFLQLKQVIDNYKNNIGQIEDLVSTQEQNILNKYPISATIKSKYSVGLIGKLTSIWQITSNVQMRARLFYLEMMDSVTPTSNTCLMNESLLIRQSRRSRRTVDTLFRSSKYLSMAIASAENILNSISWSDIKLQNSDTWKLACTDMMGTMRDSSSKIDNWSFEANSMFEKYKLMLKKQNFNFPNKWLAGGDLRETRHASMFPGDIEMFYLDSNNNPNYEPSTGKEDNPTTTTQTNSSSKNHDSKILKPYIWVIISLSCIIAIGLTIGVFLYIRWRKKQQLKWHENRVVQAMDDLNAPFDDDLQGRYSDSSSESSSTSPAVFLKSASINFQNEDKNNPTKDETNNSSFSMSSRTFFSPAGNKLYYDERYTLGFDPLLGDGNLNQSSNYKVKVNNQSIHDISQNVKPSQINSNIPSSIQPTPHQNLLLSSSPSKLSNISLLPSKSLQFTNNSSNEGKSDISGNKEDSLAHPLKIQKSPKLNSLSIRPRNAIMISNRLSFNLEDGTNSAESENSAAELFMDNNLNDSAKDDKIKAKSKIQYNPKKKNTT